jgi:outer membrane biosynthesis protein TonB
MFKLQDNYIASLEDLRTSSRGDVQKVSQIEEAIQVAEEQKNRLQKVLRKNNTGGGRFRGGPAEKFQQGKQEEAGQNAATTPAPTPEPRAVEEPVRTIPVPESKPEPRPIPEIEVEPEPAPVPEPSVPVPSKPEYPVPSSDASGKPAQNTSGVVPAVMASISAEGQPGLVAQNIQKWGELKKEGQYWTVEIDYMADSIFGVFPSRAKAFIRQNKVVKWETLAR